MKLMKAIVVSSLGGTEVLEYREDVPIPEPGKGEVLIRVAYSSMNPLDAHARAGRVDWGAPTLPFSPGYEFSGIITKIGKDVDESLLNEHVISVGQWGGNAEYAIANAELIVIVPSILRGNWKVTSTFHSPCLAAYHLLHTASRVKEGQSVYVTSAAGSVGLMVGQMGREMGVKMYGSVRSGKKKEFAMKNGGFEYVVDMSEEDVVEVVKEKTGGRGVDVLIDGICSEGCMEKNIEMTGLFGQIIYIGAMAGLPPTCNTYSLFGKSISVRGFVVYHGLAVTGGKEREEVAAFLADRKYNLPITVEVGLKDVPRLHEMFEGNEICGKSIIRIGGDL